MSEVQSAQRRHLTILFSDLSDSTGVSSAMEPEIYGELLLQIRSLFTRIIARHGGEIVRIDGDGVLSIFGYPDSIEDGGRRATEAAIDLHSGVALLDAAFAVPGTAIRLHSGIHSGVVLLSSGDLIRGRFEILGDATNLTAHLCDLAGPDEIFASEAALGPDLGFFRSSGRQMVRPKGASLDLPAYSISGRAEVPSRFEALIRRGVAPFAGRQAELDQLNEALEASSDSGTSGVIVVAPSGMGKSRLLSEFVDQLGKKGVFAHRGYCETYLGARSLQPFAHLVQSILATEHGIAAESGASPLREILPDHEANLAFIVKGSDDGQDADGSGHSLDDLSDALLALINLRSETLILCIDDWQWVDESSLMLLNTVMRDAKRRVFVILASRSLDGFEELPPAVDPIFLPPLSDAESRATIAHLLAQQGGVSPSRFHVRRIIAQAGGCPLFIEELCQSSERLIPDDPQGNSSLWLESLVQARCAALAPRQRDLIKMASVIGQSFPVQLLEGIAERSIDPALIDELSAADFIYSGELPGTLRFKHSVTRDAVYRTVGLSDRKRLHGRVAQTLLEAREAHQGSAGLELLAYHCAASENYVEGIRFAMMAGRGALAASSLDRAQPQFESAFRCYQKLSDKAASPEKLGDIVTCYGRACVVDPSADQLDALELMVSAARAETGPATLALALYWQGAIEFGLGHARRSIVRMDEALEIAASLGRDSLAAQIKASLGEAWFDVGDCDSAIDLLNEAVAAMQGATSNASISAYAFALANLAQVHAERGEFESANAYLAEVDRIIDAGRHVVVSSLMTQKACISIWKGDYTEAAAFAGLAESHGLRDRSRQNAMLGQAMRGYAQFKLTQERNAADDLLNAVRWLHAASYGHRISLFYGWASEVLAELGDVAPARSMVARAFIRARAGDSFGYSTSALAMANLAAAGHSKGNRNAHHYVAIAQQCAANRRSPRIHAQAKAFEPELASALAC